MNSTAAVAAGGCPTGEQSSAAAAAAGGRYPERKDLTETLPYSVYLYMKVQVRLNSKDTVLCMFAPNLRITLATGVSQRLEDLSRGSNLLALSHSLIVKGLLGFPRFIGI